MPQTQEHENKLILLDVESGASQTVVGDGSASEEHWIGEGEYGYFKSNEDGAIEWVVVSALKGLEE